ncbi:hypothetical protein [uncultured Tyzzerella sp.]|uniref:hypothetical protein n=1 Tax=uncultured Tyzzerella sp. TaxID=2321398 RepID=UPI002941CAD1|nr:hypothetical protein [uncultured Tyzzerella sp.]
MENIIIEGAYQNNLKNIDLEITINSFNCIVGVSGCGKSSLVYDVIYAESQRNFIQSVSDSLYIKKIANKPKVKKIKNLRPVISLTQTSYNFNPRSTVGTFTEISYFLRGLYSLVIGYESNEKYAESKFSFNSPLGCCKKCEGTGEEYVISEDLIMPDKDKSLKDGAIIYYKGSQLSFEYKSLMKICELYNIDINKSINELTEQEKYNILYREDKIKFDLNIKKSTGKYRKVTFNEKGVIPELNGMLKNIKKPSTFLKISKFLEKTLVLIVMG